jgi:hypothetical protein
LERCTTARQLLQVWPLDKCAVTTSLTAEHNKIERAQYSTIKNTHEECEVTEITVHKMQTKISNGRTSIQCQWWWQEEAVNHVLQLGSTVELQFNVFFSFNAQVLRIPSQQARAKVPQFNSLVQSSNPLLPKETLTHWRPDASYGAFPFKALETGRLIWCF